MKSLRFFGCWTWLIRNPEKMISFVTAGKKINKVFFRWWLRSWVLVAPDVLVLGVGGISVQLRNRKTEIKSA